MNRGPECMCFLGKMLQGGTSKYWRRLLNRRYSDIDLYLLDRYGLCVVLEYKLYRNPWWIDESLILHLWRLFYPHSVIDICVFFMPFGRSDCFSFCVSLPKIIFFGWDGFSTWRDAHMKRRSSWICGRGESFGFNLWERWGDVEDAGMTDPPRA